MDAVKFVEARRRMSAVTGWSPKYSLFDMNTPAEKVVREVEEWSAAHPRKTRQSVFLKQYPEFSSAYRDDIGKCAWVSCAKCRREFWMKEVE